MISRGRVMDRDGTTLRAWAEVARPGERRVYHMGFLARSVEASGLATAARDLQEAGKVRLFQKRIAEDVYAYIAQRRA